MTIIWAAAIVSLLIVLILRHRHNKAVKKRVDDSDEDTVLWDWRHTQASVIISAAAALAIALALYALQWEKSRGDSKERFARLITVELDIICRNLTEGPWIELRISSDSVDSIPCPDFKSVALEAAATSGLFDNSLSGSFLNISTKIRRIERLSRLLIDLSVHYDQASRNHGMRMDIYGKITELRNDLPNDIAKILDSLTEFADLDTTSMCALKHQQTGFASSPDQ